MASLMLQMDGHTVVTAASGEEAIDRLEGAEFDVLLSDVGMGEGMNGWELAERVKQRWPGTRILIATGWGTQIDQTTAAARAIELVIAKPYRIADLRNAIRRRPS